MASKKNIPIIPKTDLKMSMPYVKSKKGNNKTDKVKEFKNLVNGERITIKIINENDGENKIIYGIVTDVTETHGSNPIVIHAVPDKEREEDIKVEVNKIKDNLKKYKLARNIE